jgi:hypothetical protein
MTAVPVPNTRKGKQAARRERVAAIRAQQQRAERRRNLITLGVITAAAAVIIGAVAWYAAGRSSATAEAIPPGVGGGTPLVQPAALVVPNTSGIGGVVAYDTAGWRAASHNGPAARALPHRHVNGPVQTGTDSPRTSRSSTGSAACREESRPSLAARHSWRAWPWHWASSNLPSAAAAAWTRCSSTRGLRLPGRELTVRGA